jgi:hypothetical protein
MKRVLLTTMLFPLAALIGASCAIDDAPTTTGAGGSAGSSGSSAGSSGSSAGSSTTTTTGSGGSGGSGGSSGEAGSGTTTGAGGDTAGSGGSGGSAGATGGSAGSAGGAAGSGGATGGSAGTAQPDAGTPTRDASGAPPDTGSSAVTVESFAGTPNMVGDKLSDSFYIVPCVGQPGDQDCITVAGACPNQNTSLPMEQQGITSSEDFKVGGVLGTNYQVTIQVNGIVEGKYYMGCTRAAGTAAPVNPDSVPQNTFCTGGTPVNVENYNIYKLMVMAPNGTTEVQHYYLNSFPTGTNFNAENHNSFAISYTATITVPGQGIVRYYTADRNCHAIDNCGPGAGRSTPCQVGDGRIVPNEANLVFPTTYNGRPLAALNSRNGAAQPFHAQLIHLRVTGVTAM